MTDASADSQRQELAVIAQGQPGYLKELHQALSDAAVPATIIDPRGIDPNA